ncbi:hypothetical protein [Mangrovibacter plantisponsor]|uniref:Chaperone protein Skp n=1 Tax=Mangrovibacter plantisponsor TaxID=451513 RepID=A0A317PWG7_9ENTR|nr:hypothetical protein [Mangrovibacter plantisponsor]PWW07009.1 hypothetical protein DES37_109129 [Mangrovibacter plantisponsor]
MNTGRFFQLTKKTIAFVLAAGIVAGCNEKTTGVDPVKFVDMEKLLVDSGLAEQEAAHLRLVNERLKQGAELAGKQYSTMDEEKVGLARQADGQILQLQWQAEQQNARKTVLAAVTEAAMSWQDEHGAVAILPRQAALSVAKDADITDDILAKLKNYTVKFNSLPEVAIKSEEHNTPATSH